MTTTMRKSTLETLGLGTVLEIFERGKMPATASDLVDEVFGPASSRGALVISGANGIVGAGKAIQLGSRLQSFGVPIVGLDFPNSSDGIAPYFPGLVANFGAKKAYEITGNIIRLSYDGKQLPRQLKELQPKFLLEAVPEILEVKKAHYALFRSVFPKIEIRSVTSGFPSSQLGVGVAHPAFPHHINKVWETIEAKPSAITRLFWALGLVPVPVSDNWSFVLDVLFCGVTDAAIKYHERSNMPFWKLDKYVRKLMGPNPLRAHDAIGAKGANFLTWSCLHHLNTEYGDLFAPSATLTERKETGQNWYPMNHFRPLVNWSLNEAEEEELHTAILGPVLQLTSLLLSEKRGHYAHLNAMGELCAQFRNGVLAQARALGAESIKRAVHAYQNMNLQIPGLKKCWFPSVFEDMKSHEWQQLYVNAEHNGKVGVITISRERYNGDVDAELNRAIDWLGKQKIESVIVSSDFHLSTQLIGADTSEFFSALENEEKGYAVSANWSRTARRLNDEFRTSVGFIVGKRCLGGFLELLSHCHYMIAVEGSQLGMPEVTLPVVPGMEGCHWNFRKANHQDWPKLMDMMMTGKFVGARDSVGWLTDYSGSLDDCLQTAWKIASGSGLNIQGIKPRSLNKEPLREIKKLVSDTNVTDDGAKAILDCITDSCGATLADALAVQARHSAGFMKTQACRKGQIGAEMLKAITV